MDEEIEELRHYMTSFTYLDLTGCRRITDEGLMELRQCPALADLAIGRRYFPFEGSKGITGEGLNRSRSWGVFQPSPSSAKKPAATTSRMRGAQGAQACDIPDLPHPAARRPGITDAGLKELRHFHAFTSLILGYSGEMYCEFLIKELKHVSGLTFLSLPGWATDESLQELKHLPNLASLNLCRRCKITDEGPKYLIPILIQDD